MNVFDVEYDLANGVMKAEGAADIQAAKALAPQLPDEARRYGLTP